MAFNKQVHNVCINLNDTWQLTIQFFDPDGVTPLDLTGRVPKVQVRQSASAVAALLDLTDSAGLTFTAATGLIVIDTPTTAITSAADYVWALELGGPPVEEPLSGQFRVVQDIVR